MDPNSDQSENCTKLRILLFHNRSRQIYFTVPILVNINLVYMTQSRGSVHWPDVNVVSWEYNKLCIIAY